MYQALYRKWRPKTFSEVVGQAHITDTLQRQVAEGRVGHAYLFTGTRGTGKTTCARILAKAVGRRRASAFPVPVKYREGESVAERNYRVMIPMELSTTIRVMMGQI